MVITGNDRIVVGSSLSALIYAYCNGLPFVASRQLIPHDFDFFPPESDLSLYGINNTKRVLLSPKGQLEQGISKNVLWYQLYFLLSLAGKNLMPFEVSSIKVDGNLLKVITPNARIGIFKCDTVIIFDEHRLEGLPDQAIKQINKFKVYDWIDVHSGQKHDFDFVETEYDLVKQIHFYKTTRNWNTVANWKDALAISYATSEDLQIFEWSDTGVMFRVKNVMKEIGIRGTRNGKDVRRPGFYKYFAIKVSSKKRELEEIREGTNCVADNLEFRYDSPEDLIKQPVVSSYVSTLYQRLTNEKTNR